MPISRVKAGSDEQNIIHMLQKENALKAAKLMAESEININLSFIPIEGSGIDFAGRDTPNQIIVVYDNGVFETLPKGIKKVAIKDYLGPKYSKIIMWAALPVYKQHDNPASWGTQNAKQISLNSSKVDLYERTKYERKRIKGH